jgi:2-aminobenzoylacetyl-CoA thioesterase
MWLRSSGPVNDRLDLLGTEKSCMYLLKGDRHMLIGAAGPWVVPELERQFDELGIDLERIRYVLISHTHFDHCGAVPYLRRRLPHLQILGSVGAARLLGNEKAVRNTDAFLQEAAESTGAPSEYRGHSLAFEPFRLDRPLSDGDVVDLGGDVSIHAFETPGHSRCSMVAYEPRRKWLFPGDSLHPPTLDGCGFLNTASESFVVYQQSLRKLDHLEVSLCGWEHHGARTEEDARSAVRVGLDFTVSYRDWVLQVLDREGDPDFAAQVVSRAWLSKAEFAFLPERVMLHIARGVVRNATEERI